MRKEQIGHTAMLKYKEMEQEISPFSKRQIYVFGYNDGAEWADANPEGKTMLEARFNISKELSGEIIKKLEQALAVAKKALEIARWNFDTTNDYSHTNGERACLEALAEIEKIMGEK